MKASNNWLFASVAALAVSAGAFAQAGKKIDRVMVHEGIVMAGPGDFNVEFLASEFGHVGGVVKGAPYSADTVNETNQTLADGTRISRKNTGAVYRDSEGRTRREQTLAAVGPWAAAKPRQTIVIHDPVTFVNYVLDPETRTASKIIGPAGVEGKMTAMVMPGPKPGRGEGLAIAMEKVRHAAGGPGESKTESLGTQMIEGVSADGTRTITTIPAGAIGNDRPLQIVSERWHSPELQATVLSRHNDPRAGETVFRLSNVRRTEPARSLFEVPSDYTIKEGAEIHFQKKLPPPR